MSKKGSIDLHQSGAMAMHNSVFFNEATGTYGENCLTCSYIKATIFFSCDEFGCAYAESKMLKKVTKSNYYCLMN